DCEGTTSFRCATSTGMSSGCAARPFAGAGAGGDGTLSRAPHPATRLPIIIPAEASTVPRTQVDRVIVPPVPRLIGSNQRLRVGGAPSPPAASGKDLPHADLDVANGRPGTVARSRFDVDDVGPGSDIREENVARECLPLHGLAPFVGRAPL